MFRCLAVLLLIIALPAAADVRRATVGGDVYLAGSSTALEAGSGRDLFAAGGTVIARGDVARNAHFAGFEVEIGTEVGQDVYAVGGTVTLRAPVAGDLTAAGFAARTAGTGAVSGNARMAGASVVVGGPVAGSLMASGGEVLLDAEVGGDVRIAAGELRFGPAARIGGRLDYTAPEPVAIPASVIDPDRVSFTPSDRWEGMAAATRDWRMRDFPAPPRGPALLGFLLITIAFFVVLAAVALSLAPERIESMRSEALARPGRAFLGGILGLATVFGLVPISVMTLVGLPLLPVILLLIVVVWILGYAFGVYAVALRVWAGMGGADQAMPGRLGVFAGGLLIAALLNVIPFAGWVVNFTLVLFGIGAIAVPVFAALFGRVRA